MSSKYVLVSGTLFGAVALIQVTRAVNQWPIQIGDFNVPVWASWIAAAVTGALCTWAFQSRSSRAVVDSGQVNRA